MATNPFCGHWGFVEKPQEEPDNRFDIDDTPDDKVTVRHATKRNESQGVTTGQGLSFDRLVENSGQTIHYHSGRIVSHTGGVTRMEGKYNITSDITSTQQSKSSSIATTADPDWVANRPG
jgi:hypothetical protein